MWPKTGRTACFDHLIAFQMQTFSNVVQCQFLSLYGTYTYAYVWIETSSCRATVRRFRVAAVVMRAADRPFSRDDSRRPADDRHAIIYADSAAK